MRVLYRLVGVVLVLIGCGAGSRRAGLAEASCGIVVYDRTPHALEIRMAVRPYTTVLIGALNPGELLTYSVPCASGEVWISGIPIPSQVGAPVSFRVVHGWAPLIPGERVDVPLQWP